MCSKCFLLYGKNALFFEHLLAHSTFVQFCLATGSAFFGVRHCRTPFLLKDASSCYFVANQNYIQKFRLLQAEFLFFQKILL